MRLQKTSVWSGVQAMPLQRAMLMLGVPAQTGTLGESRCGQPGLTPHNYGSHADLSELDSSSLPGRDCKRYPHLLGHHQPTNEPAAHERRNLAQIKARITCVTFPIRTHGAHAGRAAGGRCVNACSASPELTSGRRGARQRLYETLCDICYSLVEAKVSTATVWTAAPARFARSTS